MDFVDVILTPVNKENARYFLPLLPLSMHSCIHNQNDIAVGGILQGKAAGLLVLRIYKDMGEIKWLFTSEALRRRGVASAILKHIIVSMPKAGLKRLSIAYSGTLCHMMFEQFLSKYQFQYQVKTVPSYAIPVCKLKNTPVMRISKVFCEVGEKIVPYHTVSVLQRTLLCRRAMEKNMNLTAFMENPCLDLELSMIWLKDNDAMGVLLLSRPNKQEVHVDMLYQWQASPNALLFMAVQSVRALYLADGHSEAVLTVCPVYKNADSILKKLLAVPPANQLQCYFGMFEIDKEGIAE